MICRKYKDELMDLLLDPQHASAEARQHVSECAECSEELRGLQSTLGVLDAWEAPEISPFFDSRMAALLREEQRAEPAGFFERVRDRLLFGNPVNLRPVLAGALAAVLLVGGGLYAGLTQLHKPAPPVKASATVQDLQSLDENSQVFQQLNSLDQGDDDAGAGSNNSL